MGDRKERNTPWLSVPQFGDWEEKGFVPDYSVDFSRIRETRKQNKRDPTRVSIGAEQEFASSESPRSLNIVDDDPQNYHHDQDRRPSTAKRRRILSYFNCCLKA